MSMEIYFNITIIGFVFQCVGVTAVDDVTSSLVPTKGENGRIVQMILKLLFLTA